MDALTSTGISQFDSFRLDLRRGELCRRDDRGNFVPVTIGSRAIEILGVLIGHPGDLISRAAIMESVWPGTVVEDSNLNVQVAALRPNPRSGAVRGELHPDGRRPRLSFHRSGDPGRDKCELRHQCKISSWALS